MDVNSGLVVLSLAVMENHGSQPLRKNIDTADREPVSFLVALPDVFGTALAVVRERFGIVVPPA